MYIYYNFTAYRIHMSNFTYEELERMGGFDCELRGVIPVKVPVIINNRFQLMSANITFKLWKSITDDLLPTSKCLFCTADFLVHTAYCLVLTCLVSNTKLHVFHKQVKHGVPWTSLALKKELKQNLCTGFV
jgi:hypothetical protein